MDEIKLTKTQEMGMAMLQQKVSEMMNNFLSEVVREAGENPEDSWKWDGKVLKREQGK